MFVWPISIDNQFNNMIGEKQGFSEVKSAIQFLEIKVNKD